MATASVREQDGLRRDGATEARAAEVVGHTPWQLSFTVVADDPSRNASTPSATVTATTQPTIDTTGPTAPGNLYAFDFGCETWLFWDKSADDVDPQYAILYEVYVNGVFDGAQLDIDRWITYGTQSSNTFTVQAIDSAGNRSPTSSLTLDNQTC